MCNVEQLELQMKIIISFASYYLIVVYSPNWFESVLVQQKRTAERSMRKKISETFSCIRRMLFYLIKERGENSTLNERTKYF